VSEIKSIDEKEEEFLKVISLKGTVDILRYLNKHDKVVQIRRYVLNLLTCNISVLLGGSGF
jgi:hypothetical protein